MPRPAVTAERYLWAGDGVRGAAPATRYTQVLAPARSPDCRPAESAPAAPGVLPSWDAGAVVALYAAHYRSLVRLAAFLIRDAALAEDVVQDCFVAMHDAWPRLRAPERAILYLRRAVINRSRSVLRRRVVADRYLPRVWTPDCPSAEESALERWERALVPRALAALSARQREALVLRYYADLTDTQVAAVMGVSKGSVKTHVSRGLASLRAALDEPEQLSARITGSRNRRPEAGCAGQAGFGYHADGPPAGVAQ